MREILLLMFSFWLVGPAYAETAEKLASTCKNVVTAKANARLTMLPQDFDSGFCWGAFAAIEQGSMPSGPPQTQGPGICIPENTPRVRLVSTFTEYLMNHPERKGEEFYDVIRDAFRIAFACSAAAPPIKR